MMGFAMLDIQCDKLVIIHVLMNLKVYDWFERLEKWLMSVVEWLESGG